MKAKEERAFQNFEAALAAFIREHQPWPYDDIMRADVIV